MLGLSDAREGARFFYDEAVDVVAAPHAVDRYLALAVQATGGTPAPPSSALRWPLPSGSAIPDFAATPFVLLHPFSRGTGKSLTPGEVVEFCRALAPMRVVIAGRAEATLPAIPSATDLLNRTSIAELIWLLRRAAFVVSVDSGPMHIAAALTPNVVAIHTWSDPGKVGPYRDDAWILSGGMLRQRRPREAAASGIAIKDFAELAVWVRDRVE